MTTTVSIIEDNRTTRESLVRLLEGIPTFRVLDAYANAEAALQSLPVNPPDVVLVDLHLPKLSGIECVCQLKKKAPGIKVLILTRFSDSENIFQALRAGADGYVLKHKPSDEILKGIIDLVENRPSMSNEVAQRMLDYFHELGKRRAEIQKLSPRERDVLEHLAKGWGDKDIAQDLGISVQTVNDYLKRIYAKLHVHSRTAAVAKYLKS